MKISIPNLTVRPKSLKTLNQCSINTIMCCLTVLFLFGTIPLSAQTKIVFSENFDNATSPQPWLPYKSTGWFNSKNYLQSISGKGKVLHIDFPANTVGVEHGLGNYRIPLDSAYKELYLSWEYFVPANFDFGWADKLGGGKFFGGFAGGSMTAIPNLDATDVDGWVSIMMFQNGTTSTYNYFKGNTFSPGGWPYGVVWADIAKGQWRRVTIRLKINDGDQSNGIFEVYDNDKLVHQLSNTKIVNSSHPEYLIEHIYLNSFFGGSGREYVSPINQFMEFDNLVAFYYPKGSSGYRSGPSEAGRVLQVPVATSFHPVPPNRFTPTNYTDATGTITSHCGYYQAVDFFDGFQTSTIQVAGATSLNLNVTKFQYDAGINYIGYKQILKIYQGVGTGRVLKQTFQNGIYTTPGNIVISGNSATIEWQAGQGSNGGFTLNYTSNGTGSGNNFKCGNCFAKQGTAAPVTITAPSAPSNLSFSDLTDRSVTLRWTDNSNNETYFEIECAGPNSVTTVQKYQSGSNTTTYASSGLIGNSNYSYRIRAYNESGYSAWSNTIQVTTNYALPTAPSGLTSTSITSSSVSLKWTDNSGIEDGFKIERSLSATSGFTEIGTVAANVTTFTNNTCSSSTSYHYRVRAYNPAGNTGYTPVLSVVTASVGPSAPSNLSYSNLTDRSLTLTWTDNSTNETSFEIERSGPNSPTTIQSFQSGANTTTFASSGLIGNSAYTFKIRAYNSSGYSAWSNTIQVTTNFALPTAPSDLISTSITSSSVGLQWTDNSGIESGFKIERSLSATSGFTEIGTVSANVTSFTNNTCSSSTTYHYRVRAYNPAGNTGYTPVLSVVTASAVPSAPSNLSYINLTDQSLTLTWIDNSNNETAFEIECAGPSSTSPIQRFTCGANTVTFNSTGLSSNSTYTFKVRAINASGYSAYSNVISVVTPGNPLSAGLIAHYNYEGSVNDITGNGHNGTLVNEPTYITTSKEGAYSLNLDGNNDNVNIGTINLGNQFTFATWVFIPSGYNNIRTIVSNTNSGSYSDGFKVFINTYGTTDRKIIVETGNGSQFAIATSAASVFVYNAWNHIAVVANKSVGHATIYLNGSNVTSTPAILTNFSTNRATVLGTMTNMLFSLPGRLDDTRFYGRLLSASEIAGLCSLPGLKSTISEITDIEDTEVKKTVPVVYPNPFTSYLSIRSDMKIKDIQVYTVLGVKAFEQFDINSNEFLLQDLNVMSSVYLVKMVLENGETHITKVIRKD